MKNYSKRWKLGSAAKHIREQIQTQLKLHRGEADAVLAHLMEELACIYALSEACEVALPIFVMAKKYGHPEPEIINSRITQMKELISQNPRSMDRSRTLLEKMNKAKILIIVGIIIFILLLWYVRYSGRKKSSDG